MFNFQFWPNLLTISDVILGGFHSNQNDDEKEKFNNNACSWLSLSLTVIIITLPYKNSPSSHLGYWHQQIFLLSIAVRVPSNSTVNWNYWSNSNFVIILSYITYLYSYVYFLITAKYIHPKKYLFKKNDDRKMILLIWASLVSSMHISISVWPSVFVTAYHGYWDVE